jgi:tRNA G10  N-methylase Trm11
MGQRLKTVLDPASSMRSFYFDKTDERVVFGDIRENETHLLTNGQTIHIKPDVVMDFRDIPYPDESFNMVVFDPPHRIKLTTESDFIKKYGELHKDTWQEDLTKGFAECFRVLKTNGTLVFKWSEVSIKLNKVLELTDQKPILGHPSGKRMGTHWVLFIK